MVELEPEGSHVSTHGGNVLFTCTVRDISPSVNITVQWFVNGTHLEDLDLMNRASVTLVQFSIVAIGRLRITDLSEKYNMTTFRCVVNVSSAFTMTSQVISTSSSQLYFQGIAIIIIIIN